MSVKARLVRLFNKYYRVKFSILFVILMIFSISIIGNIVYSVLWPVKYPTDDMEDIIKVSDIDPDMFLLTDLDKIYFYSSVIIADDPISSSQRTDVTISSLHEIQLTSTTEIYLVEAAHIYFEGFILYRCDLVENLKVSLNGKIIDHHRMDIDGEMYYGIDGFNLTEINKITKLEMTFNLKRTIGYSNWVRVPWIFNKKYARLIDMPLLKWPLKNGSISDLYSKHIDFKLPIQRILTNTSGWKEWFIFPFYDGNIIRRGSDVWLSTTILDYPINQTIRRDGNLYHFETYFSNDNIASRFSLTIIPEFRVVFVIGIFLFSPFFVYLNWFRNGKIDQRSEMKSNKLFEQVLDIFNMYWWLIVTILINTLYGDFFAFWGFIYEITPFIYLLIILIYPTLSSLFFTRALKERRT